MQYKEVIQSLQKKEYQPIYLLHGNESYFIDIIVDKIENGILSEGEKSFNLTVLYGKDTDYKTVLDNARRYPMMSPYQVIIVKEAQEMRTLKQLESYILKPTTTTILCLVHKHKKFDKRTKFGKAVAKNATVVESKKLYDNQIPDWIHDYLRSKKIQVGNGATDLLAEYLGNDLSKIANELDKLSLNLKPGEKLTPQLVQDNIGISKDYNVFELQNALGKKDVLKANRIVNYFAANPKSGPLVLVIGALYNYFSKVYMLSGLKHLSENEQAKSIGLRSSYFLKDYKIALRNYNRIHLEAIFDSLKSYDLRSKGVENVSVNSEGLLRELIWKILHLK